MRKVTESLRSSPLVLAVVALLSAAACASTDMAASNGSEDVSAFLESAGYTRLEMQKLATGHETIPVTINGVDGLFVVDTGAGGTVVHAGALERFGLTASTDNAGAQAVGAGGATAIQDVAIDSFALDGIAVPLTLARTLDLAGVVGGLKQATGVDVHGVVGQDILTTHEAILVIADQNLFLKIPTASN